MEEEYLLGKQLNGACCETHSAPSLVAVHMEVLEMGESRGGKEVLEHTGLASLLVLF